MNIGAEGEFYVGTASERSGGEDGQENARQDRHRGDPAGPGTWGDIPPGAARRRYGGRGAWLNLALDLGINFLDTAACYASTEALMGSTVSHRRDEFFLASKCGHAVDTEAEPWTAGLIAESVDRSLRRLKTDYLDILHLHSCGLDVLKRGEVIEALVSARDQGKTRFIGYSGDNEAALWAVGSGIFDTLQTSFSLVDQSARRELLGAARDAGIGIIGDAPEFGPEGRPLGSDDGRCARGQCPSAHGTVTQEVRRPCC